MCTSEEVQIFIRVTYPEDGRPHHISRGARTTTAQLGDDWMLTHEMIHLAFPSIAGTSLDRGRFVRYGSRSRVCNGSDTPLRMWA